MKNTFIFVALTFCPLFVFTADNNNTSKSNSKDEVKKSELTKDPFYIGKDKEPIKPVLPEELRAKKKN